MFLGVPSGDFVNFPVPLTKQILSGIARIDRHCGLWSAGNPVSTSRLVSLAEAARTQSTAAACRLSGLRISDNEVARILGGDALRTPDDVLVKGYAASLGASFASPNRPLRPADIAMLHALALTDPYAKCPSDWRSAPLIREAFDASGHATGRVFSTLSPRQIEPQMQLLTEWLDRELQHPSRHPIPAIATFALGLLAASPFETGNGRCELHAPTP